MEKAQQVCGARDWRGTAHPKLLYGMPVAYWSEHKTEIFGHNRARQWQGRGESPGRWCAYRAYASSRIERMSARESFSESDARTRVSWYFRYRAT